MRERKYINIFTVIGILLSIKISQDAELFSNASCTCNDSNLCKSFLAYRFQLRERDRSSAKYLMHFQSQ